MDKVKKENKQIIVEVIVSVISVYIIGNVSKMLEHVEKNEKTMLYLFK